MNVQHIFKVVCPKRQRHSEAVTIHTLCRKYYIHLKPERRKTKNSLGGWWPLQAGLSGRMQASHTYFCGLGFLLGTTYSWPFLQPFGHVWFGENNWISLPLPTKTHEARYEERNCGRRVVDFTSLIVPTACKDTYVASGSNKVFSSARFLELSICKQGQLRY